MGITISKNPLVDENFDGESGDYLVEASNYTPGLNPEWFVVDSDIRQLRSDLRDLATVPEDVDKFTFVNHIVAAKCIKVYDGDTAHFAVKYNDQWVRFRCRLTGYNSAEMIPKKAGLTKEQKSEIKEQAIKDRDYLAELLLNQYVLLHLHDFDKYGRPLTDVYLVDDIDTLSRDIFEDETKHVNSLMIKNGHGVVYNGRSKKKIVKRIVKRYSKK